ncbi:hypothetical protein [Mesomycoplasma hyorhinis]|uniref:hypothetical protein n=1 Tax=Mesomycoplasma hyorhinis TaxID=2100 RepID=UPI001C04FC26|nr:hypothetical protein [Mesomycoplasma hyorhinis]
MKLKKIALALFLSPALVLASCSFNTSLNTLNTQTQPTKTDASASKQQNPEQKTNNNQNTNSKEPIIKQPTSEDDTKKQTNNQTPTTKEEATKKNKLNKPTNQDSISNDSTTKDSESTKRTEPTQETKQQPQPETKTEPEKEKNKQNQANTQINDNQNNDSNNNTSQNNSFKVNTSDNQKNSEEKPVEKLVETKHYEGNFSKVSLDQINKNITFPEEYKKIKANYESGFIEQENDKAFLGKQNDKLFVYDLKKSANKEQILAKSYTEQEKDSYFNLNKEINNEFYSIFHTQDNKIWNKVEKIAFESLPSEDTRFEDIYERNLRISIGTSTILDTDGNSALLVTNKHVTRAMKLQDVDPKLASLNIKNKENLRFYNYILKDFFKIYFKNKFYTISNDLFIAWEWEKYKYNIIFNSNQNNTKNTKNTKKTFTEEEALDFEINLFNKYFKVITNFDNKNQDISLYYFNYKQYIKDWEDIIKWILSFYTDENLPTIVNDQDKNTNNQQQKLTTQSWLPKFFDMSGSLNGIIQTKEGKRSKNYFTSSQLTKSNNENNYNITKTKLVLSAKGKEQIKNEIENFNIFKQYWDHMSKLNSVKIDDKIWKENEFDDSLKIGLFWPKKVAFKNAFKGIKISSVPIFGKDEKYLNVFYYANNGHGASGAGIFNRDGSLAFINSFGFLFEGKDPQTNKPISNLFYLDSNLNTFLSGGVVLHTERYNLVDEIYKFYFKKQPEIKLIIKNEEK